MYDMPPQNSAKLIYMHLECVNLKIWKMLLQCVSSKFIQTSRKTNLVENNVIKTTKSENTH